MQGRVMDLYFYFQVEDILNAALAKKITKQLEHPDRRQMIFELLGPEFTKKYFPDHEQHLALLVRWQNGDLFLYPHHIVLPHICLYLHPYAQAKLSITHLP